MSIIPALNHCQITKVEGMFTIDVRTPEMRDFLLNRAEKTGMKVVVNVIPPPHHFKSKEDYLKYLVDSNSEFKHFVKELGLKLVSL